jgi:sugar transferase (PEP-CTERM system associated)
LIGFIAAYFALSVLPARDTFQSVLPTSFVAAVASLALVRVAWASGKRLEVFDHRVLVLGTGQDALAVKKAMTSLNRADVTLVGFYPSDLSEEVVVGRAEVLSPVASLEGTVQRLQVKEVIVALRQQRGGMLPLSQLLTCRLRGVRITDLSDFFERVTGEVPVDSLKASWLIYGDGFRQGWARRAVKRMFDLAAAALLLIVASPVMIATSIAIFLESGYPILFRQERVGHGGRAFHLIKFRSMGLDAEKDGMPRWASSSDSRVTNIGRFIRRTRIDELPQIFNVLKNEMSFVGPRPERPYFVAQLTEQIPFYGARHTIKPGLTGWAQVQYSYGATIEDAVRKLQFDLYYVKNHTLFLDLVILLKTVKVVLLGQGAR